jgi:CubicO group peptidase (beta-lactamase class C family)
VKPETTVESLLPPEVKVPSRNGKKITLLDLSMQVSGLARMPNNFAPADPANPFADYGTKKLYEFLAAYELPRDIGEKYEYSNLGAGLLGHALSRKAGKSYEELVTERVLRPLGMKSTAVKLTPAMQARLAVGHDAALQPTANWDLDALAGAGALRSTANDMAIFLEAAIGLKKTALDAAFARMRSVERPTGSPQLDIQMGWHKFSRFGTEIIWHNGGTGGYRTWAGFGPATRQGAVVLCNTSFPLDDLGLHLVEAKWPAGKLEAPAARTAVSLAPEVLARYVGVYELAPQFSIAITVEDGHLSAQATGQPRFELYAESEKEFFLKVVDAQISFTGDGLVLHQGGQNIPGKKKN